MNGMDILMKAAEYRPQSPEERVDGISVLLPLHERNGFVFLVARTRKINHETEPLFQLLSDHVHRLIESFGSEANAQHRFEQFLGAMNETLATHVREGRWNVPIQQFDAVVGIACDEKMFLSGAGDLCALFLHRKPSQRYQIFNLFRSIQTEQSLPTWEKPFAVVLDGDLHEGDVFAISSQDIQRTIGTDELNTILTTLPPSGATEKIRQYFPQKAALSLIILKLGQKTDAILPETRAIPRNDLSIRQFKAQEEATQQLLADQMPRIQSMIQILKRFFKRVKEIEIWRIAWRWFRRWMWDVAKKASHLKTTEGRVETKKRLQGFFTRFTRIPRSTKYLGLGVVAVVCVLVIGVSMLSASHARSEEQRVYAKQIEVINDFVERADGAVIYKDENQARGLFIQALALIDKLPIDTEERTQKVTELKETVQKSMDDIRHLVTVPNPALLGDLAVLTDGVFGQSFVRVGQELYVFASDGRVYRLEKTEKLFKPAATQAEGGKIALSASADDDHVYALMSDQTFVEFVSSESSQRTLSIPKVEGTFVDMVAYANRLYLLTQNGEDGQVYRSGRTGDAFGAPTRWITSKTTSLKEARSITIDGTVFVLQKNGQIDRFVSGSEVEWETGVVDPPITNASNIWTDTDSAYLYILEPDTKRLIVFNKETGAFVVQYRSEAFQNLTDLIVDEASYAIYLLSGSKIYSIAPSHITR